MFGSAWCLVMAQIQFSLIKKIKIGRPEHSLTYDNISFFPYPLPPLKLDIICVSPLTQCVENPVLFKTRELNMLTLFNRKKIISKFSIARNFFVLKMNWYNLKRHFPSKFLHLHNYFHSYCINYTKWRQKPKMQYLLNQFR